MKTKTSPFRVRPFKNPSGQIVYQVDGFINGKRIRKNLSTRKEALAEKSALELQAVQSAASNLRMVGTHLSDDELYQILIKNILYKGKAREEDKGHEGIANIWRGTHAGAGGGVETQAQ